MSNWQQDIEDWINDHEEDLAYEFAVKQKPDEFFAFCQEKYRESKMWEVPDEPMIEETEQVLQEVLDGNGSDDKSE